MQKITDSRSVLADAIRRALSGQEIVAAPLAQMMSGWHHLNRAERGALLQLQNWSDDGPLRQQFARHAEYSENRLARLLNSLEG